MNYTLLLALVAVALPAADAITYPADAGIINVKSLGAVGDGIADDTAAIQSALTQGLDKHQIVYLPVGTFKVSATLRWKHEHEDGPSHGWGRFLQMRGAGQGHTVIIVAPNTPGFDDAAKPQAVVQTGSSGSHGNKQYWNGEGNEAFCNHLRDFTIAIGAGNPGAIGISYQASNVGAMRDVTLRAAPDSGITGIDLTRRDNGPGLLSGVTIEGFAVAVRARQEICQFVGEHLTLINQRECGIVAPDAVIALRGVVSTNQVPTVHVSGVGLCNILDSTFTGTAATKPAVIVEGNEARLLLRDVTATGYLNALDLRGIPQPISTASWWTSDPGFGPAAANPPKRIAVQETPHPALPPSTEWALVAAPGEDDVAAVEAAFATKKAVVCFRRAKYNFSRGLTVPGHVRWLMGLGSKVEATKQMSVDEPMFRFAGGAASDTTVVDDFRGSHPKGLFVLHEDARTLALRDLLPFARVCENRVGAGPLFIEDCSSAGYQFAKGTSVFIRQWNAEGHGEPKVVIDGAQVWALGSKHEGAETFFSASAGSVVEVYGSMFYTFGTKKQPAFIVNDASAVLSFAGTTYTPDGFYKTLVREQRAGETVDLMRDAVPRRNGGRAVVSYVTRP